MPGALLKSREYTYLREVFHFPEDRTVIIAARDVPGVESENKTVKVENYQSVMVIKYAGTRGKFSVVLGDMIEILIFEDIFLLLLWACLNSNARMRS